MSDLVQEKTEEQEQPTAFMVALSNGRRIKVQSVMTNSANDEVVTSEHEMIVPDDVPTVKGMGYEEKEPYDEIALTMGPTSFDEIEAIEQAAETQSRLSELYHKFTQITRNVLHSMGLTPDEKVSAINQATGELQTRLSETVSKATDETGETAVSEKQATKTEGGVNYRASDYADVPDAEKPSTWKLRLAEGSSGNFTVEQVARAITAMQPSGFMGNPVQLGQSRAAVASKISGVINRLSATDEQKAKLRKRLSAVKSLQSGFKVFKGKDGRYRWLGYVTNKFNDRDDEILTDESHKEFIEWLDNNPDQAPWLWTWHIAGTARKYRADFWGYLNGFVIRGGYLTEDEAIALEKAAEKYDLGMSHGFYVLEKDGRFIKKYRTFEDSVLLRMAAANPWTNFVTIKEANDMALSDTQRKLAVELHGEEFVAALEAETKDRAELLQTLGIESKEKAEQPELETTDETVVTEQGSEQETKAEDDESEQPDYTLDDIINGVVKALNLDELAGVIKAQNDKTLQAIDARLKALETDTDEKMEKMLTPRGAGFDWSSTFRPSTSDKTVMSEDNEVDKDLKEKAPKQNGPTWLAETFGQAVAPNGH